MWMPNEEKDPVGDLVRAVKPYFSRQDILQPEPCKAEEGNSIGTNIDLGNNADLQAKIGITGMKLFHQDKIEEYLVKEIWLEHNLFYIDMGLDLGERSYVAEIPNKPDGKLYNSIFLKSKNAYGEQVELKFNQHGLDRIQDTKGHKQFAADLQELLYSICKPCYPSVTVLDVPAYHISIFEQYNKFLCHLAIDDYNFSGVIDPSKCEPGKKAIFSLQDKSSGLTYELPASEAVNLLRIQNTIKVQIEASAMGNEIEYYMGKVSEDENDEIVAVGEVDEQG